MENEFSLPMIPDTTVLEQSRRRRCRIEESEEIIDVINAIMLRVNAIRKQDINDSERMGMLTDFRFALRGEIDRWDEV